MQFLTCVLTHVFGEVCGPIFGMDVFRGVFRERLEPCLGKRLIVNLKIACMEVFGNRFYCFVFSR